MNEPTRQAALEAYKEKHSLPKEWSESQIREESWDASDGSLDAWLMCWELATQAAYERAAQVCIKHYAVYNQSSDVGKALAVSCLTFAEEIRALANESSGKGEKG